MIVMGCDGSVRTARIVEGYGKESKRRDGGRGAGGARWGAECGVIYGRAGDGDYYKYYDQLLR